MVNFCYHQFPNHNFQRPWIHFQSAVKVLGLWFLNLVMKADYLNLKRRHEILQVDAERGYAFAHFVWEGKPTGALPQ